MDEQKRKQLEEKGWVSTTVDELFGLTPEESAYIEFKLNLSNYLKSRRQESEMTQTELAKKIGSSQSRVAKMEKGDPSVSIDLMVKSLFALQVSQQEIGRMLTA